MLADAPTGLLLVLGVLGVAVLVLAARGILDWVLGPDPATATYRLVQDGDRLELADADEARESRLVGLDGASMRELMDEAEDRNEIRLHTVIAADGSRQDWEDWRRDESRGTPTGVIVEDSKGLVEIHNDGRLEATPPLDDAVRSDLMEVLRGAVS